MESKLNELIANSKHEKKVAAVQTEDFTVVSEVGGAVSMVDRKFQTTALLATVRLCNLARSPSPSF